MDNLDVLGVTNLHLKQIGVEAFNKLNEKNVQLILPQLNYVRTGDKDKVLLQDTVTKSGVVISKINIADIFPEIVSIQELKVKQICTALPVYEGYADKMNSRYSVNVVSEQIELINANTSLEIGLIRDFVMFCRVYGFFELKINDVNLVKNEDKLIIVVNENHTLFTGRLEVLV
jgi:hypothetical protein